MTGERPTRRASEIAAARLLGREVAEEETGEPRELSVTERQVAALRGRTAPPTPPEAA